MTLNEKTYYVRLGLPAAIGVIVVVSAIQAILGLAIMILIYGGFGFFSDWKPLLIAWTVCNFSTVFILAKGSMPVKLEKIERSQNENASTTN